jgi:hypothetical protein
MVQPRKYSLLVDLMETDGKDVSEKDVSEKNVSEENNSKKIGNKFGKEIEFREGAPIQLLRYNEKSENDQFGQIVFNQKALDILKDIREPLAIISVGK